MKKILHISTYYHPQYGGIEQVAYDIVDILKDDKLIENRVICFSETGRAKEELINGVKVYKIGFIKKIFSQAISFSYYFKLKKIIDEYQPEFIHLHLPNPLIAFYLNIILNRKKEIKLVSHWHSDIVKQAIIKKIYKNSQDLTLKKSFKIIVTSLEYSKYSIDLKPFLEKIIIVPNIINENQLKINDVINKKIKKLKEEYLNKKIIFFIGVHREYKGLDYLIEAANKLDDSYIILIAGKGPLTKDLKEKSKNNKNIRFLGKITNEEKIIYLNISDVFAFPSITKNEAFGVALAEALYFGVPATTFKIEGSGVNWVNIHNFTGIEVTKKDSELYYKGLLKTFEKKEEFSFNAKQRTKEKFTKQSIKATLFEVYK